MAESRVTTKQLQDQLNKVSSRLSKVVDDYHVLKEELNVFKSAIAQDLTKVIKKINS
jgi:transcriptional antiterminator